jgi:CubicO group peptidase (beta-lactamase class C family)
MMICSGIAQKTTTLPYTIDSYINRVMQEFEVPGISLALVKDGQILLTKGYGLSQLGESTLVDAKTLFGIASNTKAFTATALALLVEEGKLEWDQPVIDYLPWFRLSDPYVTREITIRDLLVHRSGLGLGAGDLLWWPASTYSREEIVRRLRFIPLVNSFRSAYAYDNVLYAVAGEVIKTISGQSWEDFVSTRILSPVGMVTSNVRHSASSTGSNVATPHARIEGKVIPVKPFISDNVNPAGGINSNAEDMANWMIVQLDSGRLADGSRLFSPKTTRELWSPVTPMPIYPLPPELSPARNNFKGYALGFVVQDYRGHKLVTHTGGLPGYLSRVSMIPDLKLGIAILTNQESSAAFNSIAHHVLDYYLDASPYNWIDAYKEINKRWNSRLKALTQAAKVTRDSTSNPSLPLEKYAGKYRDAWYGDIMIKIEKDGLEIQFRHTPDLVGALEHWQYDTFIARWYDRSLRGDAFVTFALNPDGSIDQVKLKPISRAVDFSFDYQDLLLKPVQEDSP